MTQIYGIKYTVVNITKLYLKLLLGSNLLDNLGTFRGDRVKDTLEKRMATHSSILAWKIPMDRRAWLVTVHEVTESWVQQNIAFYFFVIFKYNILA